MSNRREWLGRAIAGASGLVLAGCETIGRQATRSSRAKSEPPIVVLGDDEDKDKKAGDKPTAENPTAGFFRPTRRSGAWSSEAAEIERDLGVR